jgi:hypothetical protein
MNTHNVMSVNTRKPLLKKQRPKYSLWRLTTTGATAGGHWNNATKTSKLSPAKKAARKGESR